MVLYRKYRPQKFEEIVGQDPIKESLISALTLHRVSHAYLFAGPRGVGKTSMARILAKAVNCQKSEVRSQKSEVRSIEPCNECGSCIAITNGTHLDLIEIDAASNRGIDDIRDLREKIKLAPTSSPYKVYIIDEVHMLTTEAFNALLKTLEEPPAHAIFILATTSQEKIPATILSRCTQFYFKKATSQNISLALKNVAESEKISLDDDAVFQIAKTADGSFRDALTILDALSSQNKKISKTEINDLLSQTQTESACQLVRNLKAGEVKEAIELVGSLVEQGKDLNKFIASVIEILRAILFIKVGVLEFVKDDFGAETLEQLNILSGEWSTEDINSVIKQFIEASREVKFSPLVQLPYELVIISICQTNSKTFDIGIKEEKKDKNDLLKNTASDRASKKLTNEPDNNQPIKKSTPKSDTNAGISKIKDMWPKILTAVKAESASIESILKTSSVVDYANGMLVIETPFRFHKERLESARVYNLITQVMEEILSQKVKYRCVLVDKKEQNQDIVDPQNVKTKDDLEAAISEIFVS